MVFQRKRRTVLEYHHCSYGTSKLVFRGPKSALVPPYVACLGGSATYGRFVREPFPAQLERSLGMPVVNLGVVNAGVDAFLHDSTVIEICRNARVAVIEAVGAHNLSNRLYSVHPRRNDRFVRASTLLRTIFSEVDFTEFNFTRHMLTTLKVVSPDRFRIVEDEVKTAWLARMKLLIDRIGGHTRLLWVSRSAPEHHVALEDAQDDPILVDGAMIEALEPWVDGALVHRLGPEVLADNTAGMVFDPLEIAAARAFLGPRAHEQIGKVLADEFLQAAQ